MIYIDIFQGIEVDNKVLENQKSNIIDIDENLIEKLRIITGNRRITYDCYMKLNNSITLIFPSSDKTKLIVDNTTVFQDKKDIPNYINLIYDYLYKESSINLIIEPEVKTKLAKKAESYNIISNPSNCIKNWYLLLNIMEKYIGKLGFSPSLIKITYSSDLSLKLDEILYINRIRNIILIDKNNLIKDDNFILNKVLDEFCAMIGYNEKI